MQGEWIRKPTNGIAVVFVHGILSSGEKCWLHENGSYWPELLKNEPEFHSVGIYIYTYQTGFFSGTYSLDDVVDDLKERLLNLDNVLDNQKIVFVCHSMGGIVVRKFLVERTIDLFKRNVLVGLYLVASPSLGSDYANWLEPIAKFLNHSQADVLRFTQSNLWLNTLNKEFKNLKESGDLQIHGKELIEDKFIVLKKLLRKQVVQPISGATYFGNPYKVPDSDHFSIAKPKNDQAIQHKLLIVFLREIISKALPITKQFDTSSREVLSTSSFGIATESKITESSSELEQLRTELGGVYAEKLESIIAMRGAGKIEDAWDKLTVELASLTGSQIPQDIQARYFYHAARCAQEDGKPTEEYTSYYKTARRLNPQLDDRTYRAFEFAAEKQFEEAIAVLTPLDSEAVAINALKYLLDFRRFSEVDGFMEKLATPVTDEMLRLQALCLLAAQNTDRAWQMFEPALSRNQDNILFQLTAGYIAFWQALPSELHSIGAIAPQFFISDMFSLDGNRERQMRVALSHSEQALKGLNTDSRSELKQAVTAAYLGICICLPDKHADAIEKAKSVLTENPIDQAPILCLMRLKADYDWSHTLEALHKACEQPYAPIWQIELYTNLLLHTDQEETAWQHLLRFENRFSTNDEDRKIYWLDRAVHCLDSLGRLNELAERITELDDCAEYRRVKAGYWLRYGKISDGLAIARELANNPGTRLDHINLVCIYHQERMWQELAESASVCLDRFKEETPAHIVEKLAQALWTLNKPIEALAVLEQYRPVFEHDGLMNNFHASCMSVQIAQGQYTPAWEASEQLWQAQPNEGLLVQRAYLQVWMGDVPRAIELLKQGVEQGFQTPRVLIHIAQYTLANDREEAFRYARDAAERFSDDPQLLLSAAMIGFESGHSDWASIQLATLRQNFPDSGLLQEIKLPTLLEWGREGHERTNANGQKFLAGQLPMHLWLDSKRASFGAEFYWRWHHNHDKPLCQHVPLPISYGGGSVEPLLKNWQGRSLIIDYSACLMAHELKLFPFLDKAFDEIYIAPCLFAIIRDEIQQLVRVQSDLIGQSEQLFERLDTLSLTWLPEPKLETGEFSGLQFSDRIDWHLAEKHNLWIVEDHFATELFESGDIPEPLKALRMTYADVLAAMQEKGELLLEENQLEQISAHCPAPLKIEQLNKNNNLLVDRLFLERLLKLDALEAATRIFNLYCIDGIREQLHSDIESYRYRNKLNNHPLKRVGLPNGLKVRIRVD